MKRRKIVKGNAIIKVAVLLILGLAIAVILEVRRAEEPASINPKIDAQKIKQLIMQGELSDHPAMFYEEIEEQEEKRR